MDYVVTMIRECEDSSDSCELGNRSIAVKEMDARDLGEALGYKTVKYVVFAMG